MIINKNNELVLFLLLIIIFLGACSSGSSDGEKEKGGETNNETANEKNEIEIKAFSNEEETIKVATVWRTDYVEVLIGDYVTHKLPHLTIEDVDWDGTTVDLEELYAEDTVPDVFLTSTGQEPLEELDSVYGLDEMIESYDVDLTHIQDIALETIRSRDKERRLVGIPQETSDIGLYYNKEIFDVFGESYPNPDESMTWGEIMKLSGKLSGERNETNYCGLDMEDLESAPLRQLSLNKTDPETGEVLIQSEPQFSDYVKLMDEFYNLPNNDAEDCDFLGKTTAMKIGWQGVFVWDEPENMEEIDVVPLPIWENSPGIGPMSDGHPWAINKHSEHKEAALQFILEGVSEEYQTILSRSGTPVPSTATRPNEEYGLDNPNMENKNVSAFFANDPAPPPEQISVWDKYVEFDFEELEESSDVIEFLRKTEEESDIRIQEAMSSQ